MIEIVPASDINIDGIKVLRNISSRSISEIKEASRNSSPVISIEEFGGEWESQRTKLKEISDLYFEQDSPIFIIQIREPETDVIQLSPIDFLENLRELRRIELETQRLSDLENGYINRPNDFVAHDEDWT